MAATAFVYLRRSARPRVGVWLLFVFVLLTGGGVMLIAPLLVGGDDTAEVIRGGLPMWFLGLGVMMWLAHVTACLLAAALLSSHPAEPGTGRKSSDLPVG